VPLQEDEKTRRSGKVIGCADEVRRELRLLVCSIGWRRSVLKVRATTPAQPAVDIYRERRSLASLGAHAAVIVERRPTMHELRVRVAPVAIEVV
jgi:hypothetical protein